MGPTEWMIVAGGVVATVLALGVRQWIDARRRIALRALAASLGATFEAEDPSLDREAFARLPLLREGLDRRYFHVLRRSRADSTELVFDHQQRVGTLLTALTEKSLVADAVIGIRKNRAPSYYWMTMVAISAHGRHLPEFEVRNGAVRSGHVPEGALNALRGLPGHTWVEGAGEWVLVTRFDRRVPADQLADFVRRARRCSEALGGAAQRRAA